MVPQGLGSLSLNQFAFVREYFSTSVQMRICSVCQSLFGVRTVVMLQVAAFDPIFSSHHGFVDYLLHQFQQLNPDVWVESIQDTLEDGTFEEMASISINTDENYP